MSIALSLLLVVGVVTARHVSHHNNDAVDAYFAPIALQEARRVCASLCMSGLGGKACGVETCYGIQPDAFPTQSDSNHTRELNTVIARRDACPLLCEYQLGQPLCNCSAPKTIFNSVFHEIDFNKICGFFCLNHNYHVNGCKSCEVYRQQQEQHELEELQEPKAAVFGVTALKTIKRRNDNIDWDEWCREKCSQGDGGVACNCDILPLSLTLDAVMPDEPLTTNN